VDGKVNQLLTAVWSPVAAVEKDYGPSTGCGIGKVYLIAIKVFGRNGRELVTGCQLGHDVPT